MEGVSRHGRAPPVRRPAARRREDGAACAEFGISRKTGYKIFHRYKGCGIEGLTDRSRRPQRYANQLPEAIEKLIVRLKREYPTWGAPKIRERLRRRHARACPAISTVHAVLDRHGLVTRRKRRPAPRGPRSPGRTSRTPCGAPTSKASSCSPTGATATR